MNQLDRIPFSALGAEQAFQDAGIELRQARALATQIELAANAGGFVTNEQLTSALSSLKLEIIDRMARGEAENRDLIAENRDFIATSVSDLHDRISRTEKELREHMATLLWRFFGGMVAMATLFFAAVRYLP